MSHLEALNVWDLSAILILQEETGKVRCIAL
jgi:hypothetical protein